MQLGYYVENNIIGKEVVIDWFQVSFDFISIDYDVKTNRYILDRKNPKFIELIKILNPKTDLIKKDYDLYIKEMIENLSSKNSGRFRFDNGYQLGENIELSFGGNKTRLDTYPAVLILTGQGCREFERSGGNWIELFKFILDNGAYGHLKIGRLDIAIDDFDGNEITPYQLEKHIRLHHYTSAFRKVNFNITEKHSIHTFETDGFAITFGSCGSNQLQIYDKNLERRANKELDKNTEVWYRYEMRFMEDMAYSILTRYIEAFDLNNSIDFMSYVKGVLKSLLDIKEYNPKNKQISRWKTLPAWDMFLDSLEKVDIKRITKRETTIEKKIEWFKDDMANTLLEFALVYDGDDFLNFLSEVISSAEFKTNHLNRLNNYYKNNNQNIIDMNEVKRVQMKFETNELNHSFNNIEQWDHINNLFRMFNNIDGFNYDGYSYDVKYFTIHGELFEIQFVESGTKFSENSNIFYLNKDDMNDVLKLQNIIKEKIKD